MMKLQNQKTRINLIKEIIETEKIEKDWKEEILETENSEEDKIERDQNNLKVKEDLEVKFLEKENS